MPGAWPDSYDKPARRGRFGVRPSDIVKGGWLRAGRFRLEVTRANDLRADGQDKGVEFEADGTKYRGTHREAAQFVAGLLSTLSKHYEVETNIPYEKS